MYLKYKTKTVQLLIILIYLFSFAAASAQNYPIRTYTLSDGMATNYTHDVTQDREGKMWFSHESGVSVYDGYKWINYSEKDGLARAEYYFIKPGENDFIWVVPISAKQPICYFDGIHWKNISTLPFNNLEPFIFLSFEIYAEKGKQVLCAGTNNGLWLYHDNRWHEMNTKDGLAGTEINHLKYSEGKLYISTNNGISVLQNGKIDNSLNDKIKTADKNIKCLEINVNNVNQIWILGKTWLAELNNGNFKVLSDSKRFHYVPYPNKHSFLTYDHKDKLFFGNEYLRFVYNIETGKVDNCGLEKGFTTAGSSDAFVDRESNIWFPNFRGVDKIGSRRFHNFYKSDGMLEDEVSAVLITGKNNMILGHNAGLTIVRNNKNTPISFANLIYQNRFTGRVMDICKDSSNNIWIAASLLGVGKLNGQTVSWIKNDKPVQTNSVAADKKGNIWVGTDDGLYKVVNNRLTKVEIREEGYKPIRKVFCFADGEIYCTKPAGLAVLKDNNYRMLTNSSSLLANSFFSVSEYKGGSKLLGTADGLYILKNDSIKKFIDGPKIVNKKIYLILKDKKENLWFGTNDGFLKWNGVNERWYSLADGLSGREANRSAAAVDEYGSIWLGTEKGLSEYDIHSEKEDQPPVVKFYPLEGINGNKYDITKDFEVSSSDNTFILTFHSISFINEKNIQYRIMLSGYDKDWIEKSNNDPVNYANIKPGSYQFIIQARNYNGIWSDPVKSGIITINAPFYLNLWFILAVLLSGAGLIYFAVTITAKLKYGLQLEREVRERTKELEESKERLLSVKKIANIGYIDWDVAAGKVEWSQEACNIFGFEFSKAPKSIEETKNLLHPHDRRFLEKKFTSFVQNYDTYDIVVRIIRPDEQQIWVRVNGKFVKDSEGNPIRMIGTVLDVTGVEQAKEKLKEYSRELKKINDAKDKLFSMVAHDLRGPFQGLLGLSQVMSSEFDTLELNEIKGYSQVLNRSLQRQYSLVNNLLNWSKLQMGNMKLMRKRFPLHNEAEFIFYLLKELAAEKKVELVNSVPESKMIDADPQLFNVVLRNIVSNAIKCSEKEAIIEITVNDRELCDEICVSDTGSGVEKEEIEKLLACRDSLPMGVVNSEEGMGLALMISRDIIEKHGGRIWFESGEGLGCRFYLSIPKAEAADAKTEENLYSKDSN